MQIEKEISRAITLLENILNSMKKPTGSGSFPDSARAKLKNGTCLYCNEPIIAVDGSQFQTRGLHKKCFKKVNRDILDGLAVELELVEKGLLAPKSRSGRKRERPEGFKEIEGSAAEAGQHIANVAKKADRRASKKRTKK